MLLTVCVLWKHKYVFIKLCLSQEECAWYHLNIKLTGAVSHTPTPDQEGMEMFDLLISQEQRLCCEVWCRHTFPQLSHYKRISCKSVINIFYPVTYIYTYYSLCVRIWSIQSKKIENVSKKRGASENYFRAVYVGASRKSASWARGRLCVRAPRAQKWRNPENLLAYAFSDRLILQVMRHRPETQYSAHFIRPPLRSQTYCRSREFLTSLCFNTEDSQQWEEQWHRQCSSPVAGMQCHIHSHLHLSFVAY